LNSTTKRTDCRILAEGTAELGKELVEICRAPVQAAGRASSWQAALVGGREGRRTAGFAGRRRTPAASTFRLLGSGGRTAMG